MDTEDVWVVIKRIYMGIIYGDREFYDIFEYIYDYISVYCIGGFIFVGILLF